VIAETGNALSRSQHKKLFADIVMQMWQSPSVEVIVVNDELLTKAIDDYRNFTDKSWGLVDCASFLVMRERGITEAFTSDHHFEQAGFACLLTP
jgi:uncharacterized protein